MNYCWLIHVLNQCSSPWFAGFETGSRWFPLLSPHAVSEIATRKVSDGRRGQDCLSSFTHHPPQLKNQCRIIVGWFYLQTHISGRPLVKKNSVSNNASVFVVCLHPQFVCGRKNPLIVDDKGVTHLIYFHINHISAGIFIVPDQLAAVFLISEIVLLWMSCFVEIKNRCLSVIHLHQWSNIL